jgi:predicted DNA-binding transcriptional regulator AlpA
MYNMPDTDFNQERFIRAKEIRARYDISNVTLYRWINSGKIPQPQFLNSQRVWKQSVLEAAEEKMLSSEDRVESRLGS